jgi:hypothetical protein
MNCESRPHHAVWLIPIVALAIALANMPYGYYQLLRVLVFCVAAYLACRSNDLGERAWMWILAGLAILYNPIVKLHLGADVWPLANIGTIGVLSTHLWHTRRTEHKSNEGHVGLSDEQSNSPS